MIETLFQTYLKRALNLPVLMEEPETPPERYIVLQKTGSAMENQIKSATFAVMSYGASLADAAAINAEVIDKVLAMNPNDGVFCAQLNSDYEYSNMQTKQYRYQAVLVIYY
jgi:hypothetical protein